MCLDCWDGYGSPAIDTPDVRLAAKLIADVYEFSCVGGNLHIAIDDWNLDDEDLDFCHDAIRKIDVHEAPPDQLNAEWAALIALRDLTEEGRASALALHNGFWTLPD
jgi:hypothetical protein